MTIAGYKIPPLASLLFWALVWEIVGRLGLVFLFPPLSHVVMELGQVVGSRTFLNAAVLTLESFFSGIAIAIAIGVPLGVLMGRSASADKLLGMWVNLFVSAPLSALVPIIMILFGMGQATIIVTVVMFAVWIIALDTRAGVKDVPPSLLAMAESLRRVASADHVQDHLLRGPAGNSRRHPPRRDPRREGRGHRTIAGLDPRARRTVRALFPQLPHGGVLGAHA